MPWGLLRGQGSHCVEAPSKNNGDSEASPQTTSHPGLEGVPHASARSHRGGAVPGLRFALRTHCQAFRVRAIPTPRGDGAGVWRKGLLAPRLPAPGLPHRSPLAVRLFAWISRDRPVPLRSAQSPRLEWHRDRGWGRGGGTLHQPGTTAVMAPCSNVRKRQPSGRVCDPAPGGLRAVITPANDEDDDDEKLKMEFHWCSCCCVSPQDQG